MDNKKSKYEFLSAEIIDNYFTPDIELAKTFISKYAIATKRKNLENYIFRIKKQASIISVLNSKIKKLAFDNKVPTEIGLGSRYYLKFMEDITEKDPTAESALRYDDFIVEIIEIKNSITPIKFDFAKKEIIKPSESLEEIVKESTKKPIAKVVPKKETVLVIADLHCLPLDTTEVLTKSGWEYMRDVTIQDDVLISDLDLNLSFEQPSAIIIKDAPEKVYSFLRQNIKIEATAKHRNPITRQGKIKMRTTEEIIGQSISLVSNGHIQNGNNIESLLAKLLGFCLGDGSQNTKKSKPDLWQIRVLKSRKIKYLDAIFDNSDYITRCPQKDNYIIYKLKAPITKIINQFLRKDNGLVIEEILKLNRESLSNIMDGIIESDGARKKDRPNIHITSINKQSLLDIQTIAHVIGYNATIGKPRSNENSTFSSKKLLHSLTLSKRLYNSFSGKYDTINRETKVGCLTVSTGMFLIRQGNSISVTGNCPFVHKDYLNFCKRIQKKYDATKIIFIGDIVDNHYQSFHPTNPDGYGAGEELKRAKDEIKKWYKAFPDAVVTRGNHDCYDSETEILTENGWKMGVDLNEHDIVATLNLDTNNIEYQKPSHLILKDYNGEMIKFKGENQLDLVVTPNHRMIYSEKAISINDPNYNIKPAFKLNIGRKTFPISGDNNNGDYGISDDYIKLIAWVITDGSILEKLNDNRFVIYQSKVEYVEEIKKLLHNNDIEFKESIRNRNTTSIMGVQLKDAPLPSHEFHFSSSKLNSLINNKYKLPKWLWQLSKTQFKVFLHEFIKGDGSFYKNRDCLIAYGKKEVLDQLQSLCLQNKIASTLRKYREKDWKLNIDLDRIKVGYEIPKIQSIVTYKGKVWCATVPNTTLVVRRNGNVSIQGNCVVNRKNFASGLSREWVKGLNDVLNVPNWRFRSKYEYNNVLFMHGTGSSGVGAAYTKALYENKSVVYGHQHTIANITYVDQNRFGMIVGSGIDKNAYAFNFSKHGKKPKIISCAVITSDGVPIIETMK